MFNSSIFLIQIGVTVLFCGLATFYDIKRNIIPNKISLSLIFFGLATNFILSIFTTNVKFIMSSIISMILTYIVGYLFWKLKIWGGGDVKLLTGIATVIPFSQDINYFNISSVMSIYPFSFSVIINAILVSFPFLIMFLFYLNIKNSIFERNGELFLNLLNYKNFLMFIKSNFNKFIKINDLEEGMIVNEYYFNNEAIIPLINDARGNLKVYKDDENSDYKYYFKSFSSGGITKKDMMLLKIMYAQNFIRGNISIKMGFPFAPSILAGLLIAIVYGDLIVILTKNLVLVI